jgi:hypothetical protein
MANARRQSLKERIGLAPTEPRPEPRIEMKIPDGDRGRELVREMSEGFAAAQTLLSERNMYLSRSESQHREIVYLRNVVTFHQGEAAYWRAQALNLVKANGELDAVIKGIEQQFGVAKRTMQQVEAINSQMDKPAPLTITPEDEGYPEPVAGMERASAALYDAVNQQGGEGLALTLANGGAPMPTPGDIEELGRRLAQN